MWSLDALFRRGGRRAGAGRGGFSAWMRPRRGGLGGAEVETLMREIDSVARYVSGLKREIGALQPNELYRDRLPKAHGDLSSIADIARTSADTIMEAGETILASDATTLAAYRAQVEAQVFAIFEACAFGDMAGQRIARVDATLGQLERRLQRFSLAVGAADNAGGYDRDAIRREVRQDVLIVEGPQDATHAIDQDAIDRLFD